MGTEAGRQDTRKATVYDLQKIFKREKNTKNKDSFTYEEIEALMDAYIDGTEDK